MIQIRTQNHWRLQIWLMKLLQFCCYDLLLVPDCGLAEGQQSFRAHSEHFGFLATQMNFPCRLRAWEKAVHLCGSMELAIIRSLFVASSVGAMPSLRAILSTWVSTTIPGLPKQALTTRLAVFLPTPGKRTNSSMLSGTFPAKLAKSIFDVAMMFAALVW